MFLFYLAPSLASFVWNLDAHQYYDCPQNAQRHSYVLSVIYSPRNHRRGASLVILLRRTVVPAVSLYILLPVLTAID